MLAVLRKDPRPNSSLPPPTTSPNQVLTHYIFTTPHLEGPYTPFTDLQGTAADGHVLPGGKRARDPSLNSANRPGTVRRVVSQGAGAGRGRGRGEWSAVMMDVPRLPRAGETL